MVYMYHSFLIHSSADGHLGCFHVLAMINSAVMTLYARQKKRHRYTEQNFDSMGEGKGGKIWEKSIETCILSSVKQIASPGWMHETSARGWCTGKTQRDGVEREVGGGLRCGTHVNPWLIHVNVWQKPLQYCKVISLQLIKINGRKKKRTDVFELVLEKSLESPWNCKEIQPVHPKGNQSWIFIGKTDAEAETSILWPPDGKNWLIGKDPDAGKDWRQEQKGTTEDEMVGWHHWLNGHEFE